MDFKDFTAGPNDNDRRLDKVLRNFLDTSKLSEIYKVIRKGLVKVNKKKSTPDYRINTGDIISIAFFLLPESDNIIQEQNTELNMPEIVFENENILIINKPYDLNVHGDENSLEKKVVEYFNSKYKNNSLSFTPGPLHRLDRKTTGLLAFSFSIEGARWFTENIKNHSIKKRYYAIVQGNISKTEEYKDYISNNEYKKGFATVTASSESLNENDKIAVSVVTPLAVGKYNNQTVTFVSIQIKTGRKHQIRSQCSLHNHPLLGDTAYGGIKLSNENRDFYLQAYELSLPENNLGLPQQIKIDIENDFMNILNSCGINNIRV